MDTVARRDEATYHSTNPITCRQGLAPFRCPSVARGRREHQSVGNLSDERRAGKARSQTWVFHPRIHARRPLAETRRALTEQGKSAAFWDVI